MAVSKKTDSKDIFAKYSQQPSLEFIDSGVDCINQLWGGGVNLGSAYALWGLPGCGKSTITSQIVKSFCKQNLKVLWLDTEKALNINQLKSFGLEKYKEDGILVILTPDKYDEIEEIVSSIAASKDFSLMVWDSESETSLANDALTVTDERPGIKAKQSSWVYNKLKRLFFHSCIASITIFQARADINIGYGGGQAGGTKMAGGFSAGHIPDVVTKLVPHAKVKDGDLVIGCELELTTEKNKFAPPFQPLRKKLIYGKGISKRIDLIDTALDKGIITMAGAGFYTLPNGDKVRGSKALYDVSNEVLKDIQSRL